jgi:excisionase family DNA binding protein
MTVKQAAQRLEISLSLCYALLASGRLKGTRHGLGRGTWRVSEEQLREYLSSVEAPVPKEEQEKSFRHVRLP